MAASVDYSDRLLGPEGLARGLPRRPARYARPGNRLVNRATTAGIVSRTMTV